MHHYIMLSVVVIYKILHLRISVSSYIFGTIVKISLQTIDLCEIYSLFMYLLRLSATIAIIIIFCYIRGVKQQRNIVLY